jgi:hypothetical protein
MIVVILAIILQKLTPKKMATQTATTTGKVITNNYYPCMMIAYTPTCKVNCGDGKHTQMNE